MWDQVITASVPVGVGFVLTGVLGALLTTRLQSRAWQRQDAVLRRRYEREQRLAAFEEISGLLDARLYAMRQLWWALRRRIHGIDTLDVEEARQNYRATLTAWNGGLNRLAALVQVHFGHQAREALESIREEFAELGFALDETLKAHFRGELRQPTDVPALGRRFGFLEHDIYQANLLLLSVLDGQPPPEIATGGDATARPLGLGMRGEPVRELQRKLANQLSAQLAADGLFGWQTERAVREFQRLHGLPVNGLADTETTAALG